MKLIFGLFLIIASSLVAQEPAPVFKSKAELVLVPTVVTQDGQPVSGLKATDFVITHRGERENIAVFEEITARVSSAQRPTLPPDVAANFGKGDPQADTIIVLLDFLNARWENVANIREYSRDIAKLFADTNTHASFLLLTAKGLVQAHSMSSDPADLYKAIDTWSKKKPLDTTDPVHASSNWASTYDVTSMSGTVDVFDHLARSPRLGDAAKLDRAATTTEALEQISTAFGGVPGRKRLIWVSTGFPYIGDVNTGDSPTSDAFQLHDKVVRAWRALTTGNIAVYPIDSNSGPQNPMFAPSGMPSTASLLEVAARTGGRTCVDLLKDCMARTLAADQHYYLLGFYLHGDQKPGWHKLKVELNGQHASIHTRNGFLVTDNKTPPTEIEKDMVITALASPLDYTGVPLVLRWTMKAAKDNSRSLELVVTSPPGGLAIDGADGKVSFDYLAFVRPVGNTEGHSYPASIRASLTAVQQKTLQEQGFTYRKEVPIAPGNYEIRVFLRDNMTTKIGTVSTALTVQ